MIKSISYAVVAVLMTLAMTTDGFAEEPKAMTSDDVEHLVKELSNWGRWGKDDQLGTLNLITPEKRQQAAKLLPRGEMLPRDQQPHPIVAVLAQEVPRQGDGDEVRKARDEADAHAAPPSA